MEKKQKEHLNIVVIGHVDSGKSTTCGHLIFKLGGISERDLQKLKEEAKQYGRESSVFAYIMDKNKKSREQGITIDISLLQFQTEKLHYTIIDAPGHRDFIKNMITGAAQADVALLIVPATKGDFEDAFSQNGQLKEHALLAFTLGVKSMIVCINKMDEQSVNYSKDRFDEIQNEVGEFLKKIGYDTKKIPFIPISGFNGDNLIEISPNMQNWYKGPTLYEVLDNMTPPQRPLEKPLRIPIQNAYSIKGVGTVLCGRIETGILKPNQNLAFDCIESNNNNNKNTNFEVKSIERHHEKLEKAIPGDNVGFNVRNVDVKQISKGNVCGEANNDPPKACKQFVAQVVLLNHPGQIKPGYTPIISCHTASFACQMTQFIAKIDRRTGKTIEENPQFLKSGDSALVLMTPQKSVCVEKFSDYPPLGRFAVRDMKLTIAVGIIKEVRYT